MEKKSCRLTIYVDRPEMMVPGHVRRRNRRMARGEEERLSDVGHVFIGLTDENGVEKRLGYYGKSFAVGPENVSEDDQINGIKDFLKPVAGIVMDESKRRFHDSIQYKITPEQFKKINKFIEDWKKADPKYILLKNNCVTFALKAARKVGIRPPTQLLFGIDSPAGTSMSIQIKAKFERFAAKLGEKGEKLLKMFLPQEPLIRLPNWKPKKPEHKPKRIQKEKDITVQTSENGIKPENVPEAEITVKNLKIKRNRPDKNMLDVLRNKRKSR